jgi:hypothetical protein
MFRRGDSPALETLLEKRLEEGIERLGDLREASLLSQERTFKVLFPGLSPEARFFEPAPGVPVPLVLLFHAPLLLTFPPVEKERHFRHLFGLAPEQIRPLLEEGWLSLLVDPLNAYAESQIDYGEIISPETWPRLYPSETLSPLTAPYREETEELDPTEILDLFGYSHLVRHLTDEEASHVPPEGLLRFLDLSSFPLERIFTGGEVAEYRQVAEERALYPEPEVFPLDLGVKLAQLGAFRGLFGDAPLSREVAPGEISFDPRLVKEDFDEYLELLREARGFQRGLRLQRRRRLLETFKPRKAAKRLLNKVQDEGEEMGELLEAYSRKGKGMEVSASWEGIYWVQRIGKEVLPLLETEELDLMPPLQPILNRLRSVGEPLGEALLDLQEAGVPSLRGGIGSVSSVEGTEAEMWRFALLPYQRRVAEAHQALSSHPIAPLDFELGVRVYPLIHAEGKEQPL